MVRGVHRAAKPVVRSASYKGFVLVVEDDDDLRDIIVSFLAMNGWHVVGVEPRPAVSLSLDRIDVLVLDVRSLASLGFKMLAEARARKPELPIVVIASFGDAFLSRRAEGMGAALVLEKPFNLEDLERGLASVALDA
jgi:two-component system, NtrC family, C4-dicarboxylate transport response regulator DctD